MFLRSWTVILGSAVRGQLGKGLGEPDPSVGIVQKAVGRLTRGPASIAGNAGIDVAYYFSLNQDSSWLA